MGIIAVANQKGGVGKTTTAVNLAGFLAQQGYRTLVVDLDAHGSLTAYFGYDVETIDKNVYRLFTGVTDVRSLISTTQIPLLDILASSSALVTLDKQMGAQPGKGLVLRDALRMLSQRYDYIIADCPPVLGILMVNALAACDRLVVPVQTEVMALRGLERMMHTLNMIKTSLRREVPTTIVPTMYDRRTKAGVEALLQLRSRYGLLVWEGVVPEDTYLREASKNHLPVAYMSDRSKGALAYAMLTDHIRASESTQERVSA
ncbi:MAG: AAA family ATPase [Gammaproteobacteria bacterium]|nr:AAA family ATPase [Gammaproteobacteria bacterium]